VLSKVSWLLTTLGALLLLSAAVHGYLAYGAITSIDNSARVETPNALWLFDDLTTNGVRPNNAIDSRLRAQYTEALTQFVLDGTGVCLGIVLLGGGVFLKLSAR
jgi:hypothetical protein